MTALVNSIDPRLVKAGDMVTLTRGSATFTGIVDDLAHEGTSLLAFGFYDMKGWFDVADITPDHWTLTAHQPAPEPEPEWKPGTLYSATVVVDQTHDSVTLDHDVRLYRNKGIDVDYWVAPSGEVIADQHVTDVRPLVVIDPAAVDVGNIIKVARDFYRFNPKADGVSPVEVGVFETLRSLGIEAP